MNPAHKRLFLLCTQRSVREVMAASLIAACLRDTWEIWMAPGRFEAHEMALVCQIL
ncbi:MAG: hypothetical protein M3Z24_06360 [Chloroflexota bacterium]|nr:hypothetical protein [Chloroflexota bacterium]